jgi:hypothetical protein
MEGPSPMMVGLHFVKEYYKTLPTQPELVSKFYQPTSTLSVGSGTKPAEPTAYENSAAQHNAQSRFMLPTTGDADGQDYVPPNAKDYKIRFDIRSIDAQASVNGGILLVVTGQIVYYSEDDDDESNNNDNTDEHWKAFVHTFFLGSLVSGTKRSFYVHNDVLRFMDEKTAIPTVDDDTTRVVKPTGTTTPQSPVVVEEGVTAPSTVAITEPEVVSPGGGVEESKQDMIVEEEEEEEEEKEPVVSKAEEHSKMPKESGNKQVAPSPVPAKAVKPNSWASLVASTSSSSTTTAATTNGTPSTPGTPSRPSVVTKVAATPAKSVNTPTEGKTGETAKTDKMTANQSNKNIRGGKRDPDFTLVIKNVDVSTTTEADIRGLFGPFASKNNAKVVGCHVSGHKGVAFVDYSAAAPVLAAVKQHEKEAFVLKGKTLEVIQKSLDLQKPQQNRRNQGGGIGGGGRHSGRAYRRSGSGGVGGGGGRNDRGGGGSGGGRAGR